MVDIHAVMLQNQFVILQILTWFKAICFHSVRFPFGLKGVLYPFMTTNTPNCFGANYIRVTCYGTNSGCYSSNPGCYFTYPDCYSHSPELVDAVRFDVLGFDSLYFPIWSERGTSLPTTSPSQSM